MTTASEIHKKTTVEGFPSLGDFMRACRLAEEAGATWKEDRENREDTAGSYAFADGSVLHIRDTMSGTYISHGVADPLLADRGPMFTVPGVFQPEPLMGELIGKPLDDEAAVPGNRPLAYDDLKMHAAIDESQFGGLPSGNYLCEGATVDLTEAHLEATLEATLEEIRRRSPMLGKTIEALIDRPPGGGVSPRSEILSAMARGLAGGAWEDPENLRRELAGVGVEVGHPSVIEGADRDMEETLYLESIVAPLGGVVNVRGIYGGEVSSVELAPDEAIRAAALLILHAFAAEELAALPRRPLREEP